MHEQGGGDVRDRVEPHGGAPPAAQEAHDQPEDEDVPRRVDVLVRMAAAQDRAGVVVPRVEAARLREVPRAREVDELVGERGALPDGKAVAHEENDGGGGEHEVSPGSGPPAAIVHAAGTLPRLRYPAACATLPAC